MGGTLVTEKDLDALHARAEIFNRFEDLGSQLLPDEAEIASHYLENLIKTRPLRRPESEQSDTNCELCAAGFSRTKDENGYYHEAYCKVQHAQNPTL